MFKILDFIGSFYYNHEDKSFSWEGIFGMTIQDRLILKDGSESIKGSISDKSGDSTFEGIINESFIEFTKKYDAKSISEKGASNLPLYYKGVKESKNEYAGYWTERTEIPFNQVLPCDKVGFFIKQLSETQKIKMIDSGNEIEIKRNITN